MYPYMCVSSIINLCDCSYLFPRGFRSTGMHIYILMHTNDTEDSM